MLELFTAIAEAIGGYIGGKYQAQKVTKLVASSLISIAFFSLYTAALLCENIKSEKTIAISEIISIFLFSIITFVLMYIILYIYDFTRKSKK